MLYHDSNYCTVTCKISCTIFVMRPLIVQPEVSCRHTRAFVFSEFVAPETIPADLERMNMCLRAVWPQAGLYITNENFLTVVANREYFDAVFQSKSLLYLSRDLDFSIRRSSALDEYVSHFGDLKCFKIEFEVELGYDGRPILILPPRHVISLDRSRQTSVQGMFTPLSDTNGTTQPYCSTTPGGVIHVICPRCCDTFSTPEIIPPSLHPPPQIPSSSDISRFEDQQCSGSESVESLDSFFDSRSERTFGRKSDAMQSCLEEIPENQEIPFEAGSENVSLYGSRRASCPIIPVPVPSPPPARRRSLSIQSAHIFSTQQDDDSHVSRVESRKEKIRMSLSRISARSSRSQATPPQETHPVSPSSIPEKMSEIMSPVSSIKRESVITDNNYGGTLRISDPHVMRGVPETCPSAGQPVFVPSPEGRELMIVFSSSNDQKNIWDTFCAKAKLTQIEYADAQSKMSTVVFALRGLIRFGDGEYGSTRTDALPLLLHILAGRHIVSDTSAMVESAEHSASLLSMLAVHPVSRHSARFIDLKPRTSFTAHLTAQSCLILQQIMTVLVQQLPRWIAHESTRTTCIPVSCRTVTSLLEIVFLYSSVPSIRSAWTTSSPAEFQQSIPRIIASIGQRIPALLPRCIDLLDAVLDHIPKLNQDIITHTASMLRSGTMGNPELAARVLSWEKRKRNLGNFFGLAKSVSSSKSMIFDEFSKRR
jgi:hypothetical protein